MKKLILPLLCAVLLFGCTPDDTYDVFIEGEIAEDTVSVLKIYSYNPDTLHPLHTKNSANLQMLKLVFEPLFLCDEEQRPLPVLAMDFSVSDDGLACTVNLKKNITWHDGTPFTAYDVESTYNGILGMGYDCIYYADVANIDNIICLSNHTIVFNLRQPQTNFVNLLEAPIVKQPWTDGFTPVGTGPYMYYDSENKSIYLNANDNWWDGAPAIKAIEVKLLPDKNTSVFSFEAKTIDVVTVNMLNWSRYSSNLDSKIIEYPSGSFNYLYLNTDNEFLANNIIRQAVAHSINKGRINTEVLLSRGTVTDSIFNPNWWMHSDIASLFTYDVKRAIEKITEVNTDREKISLRLLVNEDNDIKFNVAGIIKDCLEEVGIEVQPEFVAWEEFLRRIDEREYDMYLGEMNYSPEVNPAYLLRHLPSYEAILNQLQYQTTDNGRKMKYHELQQMIAQDIPLIPLYFDVEALFCASHVSGDIRPLRGNSFYNAARWEIE